MGRAKRHISMKGVAPARPAALLFSDLEQRVKNYALAAGAGCLLLAQPLAAEVVYTKADIHLRVGKAQLDFDHNGTTDLFLIEHIFSAQTSMNPLVAELKLVAGGSSAAAVVVKRQEAAVLKSGDQIGSSQNFRSVNPNKVLLARIDEVYNGSTGTCCNFFYGNWKKVTGKYLGVKFNVNGQVHYGWARLTVESCCKTIGFQILVHVTGYAYETNPDTPILAGQTSGSLGSLALGALALHQKH